MARKKIVFVIVEGPSDEEALGLFFNRIYDKNSVHVQINLLVVGIFMGKI